MYGMTTLPATGGLSLVGLASVLSGSVWVLLIGFFLLALALAIWRMVPRNEA